MTWSSEICHIQCQLRPHRHRHRPRRLCLRHPRGAARHEGRGGREARDPRRHLPQRRLHPVEGAAARLRDVRGGRAQFAEDGHRASARRSSISPTHDEVQGRGGRRQRQGRRLPVQEEQDRHGARHRPDRRRPARSRSRPPTARRRRWRPRPSSSPPARTWRRSRGVDIDEQAHRRPRPARIALDKVPGQLLVVGAGVIGLELGSVWRRLGAKVTRGRVPRPHPARHGRRGGRAVAAHPGKAGHRVQARLQGHRRRRVGQRRSRPSVEPAKGGAAETIEADVVLVAIGRVPYTDGLGLDEAGVEARRRAAASSSTRISPPTCRASTPSAT